MKRILLISLLLLAVIFTVSADRRRMLMTRNVNISFSAPDSFPGLYRWWRSESLIGADGTALLTWTNSAPGISGGDLTQGSAPLQPFVTNNIQGSYEGLTFDGTADCMTNRVMAGLAQPVTYMFVARRESKSAWAFYFDSLDAGNRHALLKDTTGDQVGFGFAGGTGGYFSMPASNTLCSITYVINGASSSIYTNGILSTNLDSGTQTLGGGMMLGSKYEGSDPFKGQMLEVMVWSNIVFNSTQVGDVHRWATNKFGFQ